MKHLVELILETFIPVLMEQKFMERVQWTKTYRSKYYSSNYYDVKWNKYKVKTRTSLIFWENKERVNKIDPYGWFQWYFRYFLGRRSSDNFRLINSWKRFVSIFKDKLVKMIKDSGGEFDDYSILPKIRQIVLHWVYELTEKDFF